MTGLRTVPDALALGNRQMCVDVANGIKQISIRTDHRNFSLGNTLVLYNEEHGFVVTATITYVFHCKLSDVTELEWIQDGFSSQDDLLAGLREFYGDAIAFDSDVTILRWQGVKGPQVEEWRTLADTK